MKKTPLLIILLVFPSIGCMWGVDTVRITTDPTEADLYYTYRGTHPWDPRVRRYAGKTPKSLPVLWAVLFLPIMGGQSFIVTIEKPGYRAITEGIGFDVWEDLPDLLALRIPHLVSVRKGSKFGWGKTYEYHFRLQSLVEIEEARQGELLDIRGVARLLRARGLRVSTITVSQWMREGQFPKPATPPRADLSPHGARWRRGDIEAWKPEAQEGADD